MAESPTPANDSVGDLFERALDLPRASREAFLEEECRGRPDLLAELTSLLSSYDDAPDFLDRLAPRVLPGAVEHLEADLDPVGDVVGHYEIEALIGRGGMGEVYRARDLDLGRHVALKFLPSHLAADRVASDRLRQEARIASALDHPNIGVVYEIGAAAPSSSSPSPRAFIAMAYSGHGTLADEIERVGALSIDRALELALQLADALAAAHEAGVVHGDVKPANLLVTDRGALKLIDFGLSSRPGDSGADGPRGGTVAYMSPEQLDGGPAGRTSDVWSAGVVLYEMLAGVPPFRADAVDLVARAVLTETPRPLEAARAAPRLDEIVRRCLERDPDRRYASAAALLTDLRTLADRSEGASLVILPFENESGDAEVDYLCDGLAEEIIADLSRARGVRVIAQASARRLRGVARDASSAAKDLGVRHALEGRLDARDGRWTVTASLIDSRTGARSWSATLEGAGDDLIRLRREVTDAVASRLGLAAAAERAADDRPPIADARAYEAYLRARYEAWRFDAEGFERARRSIDAALAIVGENDLLLATLGHITAMVSESGIVAREDAVREVDGLAARVLRLNPRSALGHWLRSWSAFARGDLRDAIRAGEHAHALESDSADVLLLLGYLYAHAGRNADARVLLERAAQLDPLTPMVQAMQGMVPVLEGRTAEAVAAYRRGHEMEPHSPFFGAFHGWALAHARRDDEAIAVFRDVESAFQGTPFASYASTMAHALAGRSDEALAAISPALVGAAQGNEMFARELAHCYALAGERGRALDWLERAVDLGMWNHDYLAEHDVLLEGVRGEPRFVALLARVRAAVADGAVHREGAASSETLSI